MLPLQAIDTVYIAAREAVVAHGWWDSPVLQALIVAIPTTLTIVWQGGKTRVRADAHAANQLDVSNSTHLLVDGQNSALLQQLADLRVEIATLRDLPRPSDAMLGLSRPVNGVKDSAAKNPKPGPPTPE